MSNLESVPLITFVIDHLRGDGAQRWLVLLAVELRERGFDVSVISLNDRIATSVVDALSQADIHVEIIGRAWLLSFGGIVRLGRILFRRRHGSVVTVLFFSDVLVPPIAQLAGVERLIRAVRSRNLDYSPPQWLLQRLTQPCVDTVVHVSKTTQSFYEEKVGSPRCMSRVVSNVIPSCDDVKRSQSRHRLCEQLGLLEQSLIFGVLGRLEQEKNVSLILEGLERMGHKDFTFLIAGEGSHLQRLKDLSATLKLQDRVRFIGFHDKPLEFLSGIDVMISASRFEGQPNTLLEAISVECPVIVSDIPEHRETIEPLVSGLDVEPVFFEDNSADSLAERLAELPHSLEALRRVSARMRSQAGIFSTEKMVSSWMEILLGR